MIDAQRGVGKPQSRPCFVRWNGKELAGTRYVANARFTKMVVHATLDQTPVCDVQEVGKLPRAMFRVGLVSVNSSQAFCDWPLCASNLDMAAVGRHQNVNEA